MTPNLKKPKTNHENRPSKPIMETPCKTIFRLRAMCFIFALQKKQQVGESNTFIQTGERDPRADMSKNIHDASIVADKKKRLDGQHTQRKIFRLSSGMIRFTPHRL